MDSQPLVPNPRWPAEQPTGPLSDRPRPEPGDTAAEVWALVERAQAGEAEAFGLIYDRHVRTVYRHVFLRVRDRAVAERLTAETFLRALRRIGCLARTRHGHGVRGWLLAIADDLVVSHFRARQYRMVREVAT